MGRTTIMAIQIMIDEIGSRIGPKPIGDDIEKNIPTYRLMSGAGVSLEIIREIVTRLPSNSRSSS